MQGTLVNLNELLAGYKLFYIPVFQRSYAWEQRNLEDLWEDIYYLDASKQHYFGTVLLKDSGESAKAGLATFKKFDIIDGQQRITTAQILIREIISHMKLVSDDDKLKSQVLDFEKEYLKYEHLYKLNPLGDDGDFFHDFVIDNKEFLSGQADTHSQRRLVEAKLYFRERLETEKEALNDGFMDFLTDLWSKLVGLQLMQYVVNSDADAIRIFETANDRGRPLSNLEKTKSFLMHTSYLGTGNDVDKVESRLQEINGRFSHIYRFAEDVSQNQYIGRFGADNFQRYHFINFESPDKKRSSRYVNELKDIIRDKLRQGEDGVQYALDYAKDLEQAFFAVQDMSARYKKGFMDTDKVGELLGKLFMVGRLGNTFPLLIAAWMRFSDEPESMARILKLLEAFTFRVYLVGRYRSNAAESRLYRMAYEVHQRRWDYEKLIAELKRIIQDYRNNEGFEANLHNEDFYHRLTSHDMKYLLSEYEIQLRRISGDLPLSLLQQEQILSPGTWQVEHIWPQNDSKLNLPEDLKQLHGQSVHKLGNLTITSWNASLSNKTFKEKRDGDQKNAPKIRAYVESDLHIQSDLKNYDEWTPKTIRKRENEIVDFALTRWSV